MGTLRCRDLRGFGILRILGTLHRLPGFLNQTTSKGFLPHSRKGNRKSCDSFLSQSLAGHRRRYLHLKKEEEEKVVPSEKQRGNANNTVPEQKEENIKKRGGHTYHVVTRRLAFALLVIRLAFGLQREPPLVSKIEINATR